MEGEELQKLGALFDELGVKPKLTSKEELQEWMLAYAAGQKPTIKKEQPDKDHEEQRVDRSRPRIPNFTGGQDRDATSYEVWKFEVECTVRDGLYSKETVSEAIRRSLKGEAAKVCVRLGPKASIQEILNKLDGLYGQVATEEALLTRFYAMTQKDGEDVTSWSNRLENVIQEVYQKGMISRGTMSQMLRSKLWTGLKDDRIKEATRYKYDTIREYDQLVVAIRQVEQEKANDVKPQVKVKSHVQKAETSDDKKSTASTDSRTYDLLKEFGSRLDKIESTMEELKSQRSTQGQSHESTQGQSHRNKKYNRQRDFRKKNTSSSEKKEYEDVVCYKCGEIGHIALGCRTRTDHLKHLKEGSPVLRDEH